MLDAFAQDDALCLDGRITRDGIHPVAGGGYADIWEGSLAQHKVAIKVIRPFESTGMKLEQTKLLRRLWREYLVWSSPCHANVLRCLGYSYDFSASLPSLVSPWMSNGTVVSYLKSCPHANRMELLVGVAKGLSYLHSRAPAIVHGDLRAGNILVSDLGHPCLCDFGLSRVLGEARGLTTSSELAGSVRWMSPELLQADSTTASVSVHSDIWAYGMTILEILSGDRPYSEIKPDVLVHIQITNGRLPERSQDPRILEALSDKVWAACQLCWSLEPVQRPSMLTMVSIMKSLAFEPMLGSSKNSQQHQMFPPLQPPVSAQFEAMMTSPVPVEMSKESPDWLIVFSQRSPQRELEINLLRVLHHERASCCICFSADGKLLATSCDNTVRIYDIDTGGTMCNIFEEEESVLIRSMCFNPTGELLAAGCNNHITIWQVPEQGVRKQFNGPMQGVNALKFSGNGHLLVSCSEDGRVRVWDMVDFSNHRVLSMKESTRLIHVTAVAISPDGGYIATGSPDGIVRLWHTQSESLVDRLAGHDSLVSYLAFTGDGNRLVSGSHDRTLKLWDLDSLLEFQAHNATWWSEKSALGDSWLDQQSLKGRKFVVEYTGHRDIVLTAAVSENSLWVVSCSRDCCVQFWDMDTGQPEAQLFLKSHTDSIQAFALSPMGNMFATASGDGSVRLWSY